MNYANSTREYKAVTSFPWGRQANKRSQDYFNRYANEELLAALNALKLGETHTVLCNGGHYSYTLTHE